MSPRRKGRREEKNKSRFFPLWIFDHFINHGELGCCSNLGGKLQIGVE
jgi:hypothetical protein